MLSSDNPFSSVSSLPYGLPDFAALKFEHLEPAVMETLRAEAAAWEEIAANPAPPTKQNTLEAIDEAAASSNRVLAVVYELASSVGGAHYEELMEKLAPILAEHGLKLWLDERIYRRCQTLAERAAAGELAVEENAAAGGLDEESQWLLQNFLRDFELAGVNLPEADKAKLRELNVEIAALETQVDSLISRQLTQCGVSGGSLSDLDGLSEAQIAAAREQAKTKAAAGQGVSVAAKWFLGVQNYSTQDAQASLTSPQMRDKILQNSLRRGFGADPQTDTREPISCLARLRAEKAQLLGFDTYADLAMADQTVPGKEAAREMLTKVATAAKRGVEADRLVLEDLARQDHVTLSAADWPYYEAQRKRESLGISDVELRPYLELNQVIERGVFYAANRLYGITLEERPDLVGWTETTRIWEVKDADGQGLGLFCGDWFKHDGKSGGAWMTTLNSASGRTGQRPIVTNDANFPRPAPDEPALLTWDQVETCFHEFGHALHQLFSTTYYASTFGTNTPTDFVELPSQLNEMWAYHPEVIANFARHWETGEVLPNEKLDALSHSKTFGQPFQTLEFVESALLDYAWHANSAVELPDSAAQVEDFERQQLDAYGVRHELVPPRFRTTYFAHAFTDGYAASYYAYMWSEAMVGELEEWFTTVAALDQDGGLNRQAGGKLRQELLSRGNSRDPMTSFVKVRGHLPDGGAVIRRRGLPLGVR